MYFVVILWYITITWKSDWEEQEWGGGSKIKLFIDINLMCHTSELLYLSSENKYTQTLIKRTSPLDPFYSLYPIIQYIKCNMLSKSLGFVHYILRFVILKFECTKIWVGGGGEWRQQVQVRNRINFQPDKTVHILLYPLNTHISL